MTPGSIEHYLELGRSLERAAIPVSHINQGTVYAVALASRVAKNVMGIHVELTEGSSGALVEEWKRLWPDIPIYVIPTDYRSVTGPLIKFLEESDKKNSREPTSVVINTFVTSKWWQAALHNQTTLWIRQAIIKADRTSGKERTIIEVPYLLKENIE